MEKQLSFPSVAAVSVPHFQTWRPNSISSSSQSPSSPLITDSSSSNNNMAANPLINHLPVSNNNTLPGDSMMIKKENGNDEIDSSSLNLHHHNHHLNHNLDPNGEIKIEDNNNADYVPVIEAAAEVEDEEDTPEIDIHLKNVVSTFTCRCHLNLKTIATNGYNVEYKRDQGVLMMKLRRPLVTASIWSSGKISVTGATSEHDAKTASRRIARILSKLGYKVRFSNWHVVNVMATINLPFGINVKNFASTYPKACCYEPELHPGATYKNDGATFKIFDTGAITLLAPSVDKVDNGVQHIYPLVHDFQKAKPQDKHLAHMIEKERKLKAEREANGDNDQESDNDHQLSSGTKKRKRQNNNNSNKNKNNKKSKKFKKVKKNEDEDDYLDDDENDSYDSDAINDNSDAELGADLTSEEEATFTSDDEGVSDSD